jgi:hypothetical protein
MTWVRDVPLKGETRNAHWILVEKSVRKRPPGRPRNTILNQV